MQHRDGDIIETLEAAGVSRFENSPGMAIEHRLPEAPPPSGVTFDHVKDAAGARDFGLVSGSAYATYGMPPQVAHAQFEDDRLLSQPHVAAFVARLEGEPVAAAMSWSRTGSPDSTGWDHAGGARTRAREACTRLATNAGFDMGARVAALQAS